MHYGLSIQFSIRRISLQDRHISYLETLFLNCFTKEVPSHFFKQKTLVFEESVSVSIYEGSLLSDIVSDIVSICCLFFHNKA